MDVRFDERGPVVLVGGAGVVGQRLARLLGREGHAVTIAGRSEERARASLEAARGGGAEARFLAWDLGARSASGHGEPVGASALVGLVNDPGDVVLDAALAGGVPYVDITRWTSRMAAAVGKVALSHARSPVVLASSWMGGLLPRLVAHLAAQAGGARKVEGAVRYALADASGGDSVDYMDRLWVPFEVLEDGATTLVEPFADRRDVAIDGARTLVGRFDTPEQWSLPLTLGTRDARVRIGFDHVPMTRLFAALVRTGLFWLLRGPRFRRLRHALLRAEGSEKREGARAAFRVDVEGTSRAAAEIASPEGQATLTAVGALLAVRWALGLREGGVFFPEGDPANTSLPSLLTDLGVETTVLPA
jgi:saccharopine dehydrogenase-like NADP-dependent oxidoreductase